ncbi:hypothetical protein ACFV1A_28685, partial [Streptomyces seoulensis]
MVSLPARPQARPAARPGTLSDPLRLSIVRQLLQESEEFDHSCGWFGLDRPKSSLTHQFKALREAGSGVLVGWRRCGLVLAMGRCPACLFRAGTVRR